MRVMFSIRAKPFSVNRMFYKTRATKTTEAREWEQSIFRQLKSKEIQEKFEKIREYFDPTKHCFLCRFSASYPPDIFFNQAGTISARTFDITNWEKPLLDLLFLNKYHDAPNSHYTKNINSDDRYVIGLTSRKKVSKDDGHWITIQIAVVDLQKTLIDNNEH